MKQLLLVLLVIALARPAQSWTLCGRDDAQYCEYDVPDKLQSGDDYYGQFICDDGLSNTFWNAFNFDKEDWDNGFGWDNYCDTDMPLGRTYNALVALMRDLPNWYAYARDLVNSESELDAKCFGNDPNAAAVACNGADVDDRVELYMGFFYGPTPVERGAMLVHEARHIENEDFSHPNCDSNGQCDQDYGAGPYTYQAWVQWDYAYLGSSVPRALREKALVQAQALLDNAFVNPPGIVLDPIPPDECPPGQVTDVDFTGCIQCDATSFADQINNQCVSCGAGRQANYNGMACVPDCSSPEATAAICPGGILDTMDSTAQ